MTLIRILLAIVALAFIALVVSAGLSANIVGSFGTVAADPWGLVALVDLYIGFLAAAVLVWVIEPDIKVRLGVIVPLFVLGNPLLLLWLAWRLPLVVYRFSPRSGH